MIGQLLFYFLSYSYLLVAFHMQKGMTSYMSGNDFGETVAKDTKARDPEKQSEDLPQVFVGGRWFC